MIKGKTESGFEFEIEDDAFDDYELLESLVKLDKKDPSGLTEAMVRLLGEDQKKRLLEHVRSKTGRVSTRAVTEKLREILNAANEKNS